MYVVEDEVTRGSRPYRRMVRDSLDKLSDTFACIGGKSFPTYFLKFFKFSQNWKTNVPKFKNYDNGMWFLPKHLNTSSLEKWWCFEISHELKNKIIFIF